MRFYIVLAVVIAIGFLGAYMMFYSGGESKDEVEKVPLYEVVEPISLEEFIGWAVNYFEEDMNIKLPTSLPEDFSVSSVWYIDEPFLAVIAFDNEPFDSYVNASFAVQITVLDPSIYGLDSDELMDEFRRFVADIRLNGMEAFVTKVDGSYVIVAYSNLKNYTVYVYDLEGGFRYVMVIRDVSLLPEDVLDIVSSMEPIEA